MCKTVLYNDEDYLYIPENLSEDEACCYGEYAAEMAREDLLSAVITALEKGPLITYGYLGLWYGRCYVSRKVSTCEEFLEVMYGRGTCEVYSTVYVDDDGELIIESAHHDGTNVICVRQLNAHGRRASVNCEDLEGAKKVFDNKTYKKPFGLVLEKLF